MTLIWGLFMKYSIFYHTVNSENGLDSFLSSGIIIKDDADREIKRIFDVSVDFADLEKLVLSLNSDNVAPEHLEGILEDYYSEHC